MIRQYNKADSSLRVYQPVDAMLLTGSSELDESDDSFTGTSSFRGVNPATGITLYYQLPEIKAGETITLEIQDAQQKTVRVLSSIKDSTYKKYDGGPGPEPGQASRQQPGRPGGDRPDSLLPR